MAMIAPAFLGREAGELAGRAVGIQAVHAALDEPIGVAAQLRLVDLAARIERHDVGRENAWQFAGACHASRDLLNRGWRLRGARAWYDQDEQARSESSLV